MKSVTKGWNKTPNGWSYNPVIDSKRLDNLSKCQTNPSENPLRSARDARGRKRRASRRVRQIQKDGKQVETCDRRRGLPDKCRACVGVCRNGCRFAISVPFGFPSHLERDGRFPGRFSKVTAVETSVHHRDIPFPPYQVSLSTSGAGEKSARFFRILAGFFSISMRLLCRILPEKLPKARFQSWKFPVSCRFFVSCVRQKACFLWVCLSESLFLLLFVIVGKGLGMTKPCPYYFQT